MPNAYISISANFVSLFLLLYFSKRSGIKAERKKLFQTLMATRSNYDNQEHIFALAQVRIEFPVKERKFFFFKRSNEALLDSLDAYVKKIREQIALNDIEAKVTNQNQILLLQTDFLSQLGATVRIKVDSIEMMKRDHNL